ncbi:MAG TPA: DUF3788 family protein [Rhizomicrobium sp.]|nr:DUF3788 family protein [Rhizomicrobium sp.]
MALAGAPQRAKAPSAAELRAALGESSGIWTAIVEAVAKGFSPLDQEWRPSKLEFGRMCLLRHKERTLLYLIPMAGQMLAGVVLGQRAYDLAMESDLPAAIKKMLSDAKPYAEGRGIRFTVKSAKDVANVVLLVKLKTIPK